MPYYAVAIGRIPGIYDTWDECKEQVHQFSGPKFKKFNTRQEANDFVNAYGNSSKNTNKNSYYKRDVPSTSVKRPFEPNLYENREEKRRKTDSINYASSSKIETHGLEKDENGFVNVYTDGACSQNGKRKARAGIGVWFSDDHPLNVSRAVVGRQTNNMAEIQAVTIAARQAQKAGIKKLKINTDSQFLINCKTKWMKSWKAKGWKTADGRPVINKEELLEMEAAIAPLQVSWNHVRGHRGIYGNEMADKLAREGANNKN
ncbi:ribonuclease H1-like [Leptopilina boulardi]|uniref:ribonuclease H1-like n=1 Tax=Leptopilina boulardi TaxID=63433 RepID=UPI0021F661B2|nr:ribonuclease H1-like [Leptopilina boulardi]